MITIELVLPVEMQFALPVLVVVSIALLALTIYRRALGN